jgi:HSP20 family protein
MTKPETPQEKTIATRPEGQWLSPFEDMDRYFEDMFRDFFKTRWLSPFREQWPGLGELLPAFEGRMPKVDLIDRDTEVVIRAELPGVKKEDLDVSMSGNTVTLRASTKQEQKEEKGSFYRRELSQGQFQRTMTLPVAVKGEEAKASFKDGILELSFPKVEAAKRKTIKVE